MFCSKCGNELGNDSEFCSRCGCKTNNTTHVFDVNDKARQKRNEITLLNAAYDYINTFWPYYSQIADCRKKQKDLQKDVDSGCRLLIITGIIASLIGLNFLFFSLPDLLAGHDGFFSGFIVFISMLCLIPGIIAIIVAIVAFAKIPKRKRKIEEIKAEIIGIDQKIQQIDYTIRELHKDKEISQKQTAYQLYFPNTDAGPYDIAYIINLMTTGRADSFKEAINLYDEHLHRNNLERMASQQLNYAKKAAAAASAAADSAAEAAAAARRNES